MDSSNEPIIRVGRQGCPDDRRRVLVVDDDPDVRFCLAECLETDGYQPILAGNGLEAMYALEVQNPHLAVIDLNMPVMSGFRLLRLLRDTDKPDQAGLPVIVISGNDVEESIDILVEAKPNDYLQKPFSLEQLLEKVHHLVPPLSANEAFSPSGNVGIIGTTEERMQR